MSTLLNTNGSSSTNGSTPITFLNLPRELRDEIYNFALVASTSIVVWSGTWECLNKYDAESNPIDGRTAMEYELIVDSTATASSIQHLVVNLLRCNNATVAHEAAMAFYTNNIFSFLGDHNWDAVVSWLKSIGARNRSYITRLDATARRPQPSWQERDGTRVKIPGLKQQLYPRHPYLYRSPTATEQGEFENINPIIETLFAMLGNRDSRSTLTLHLLLDPNLLPSVELSDEDQSAH